MSNRSTREAAAAERAGHVRAFNRFYTNLAGVLRDDFLRTPYSLTEGRLLFELAQQDASQVADLRRDLDIDAGYMSRILARFESDGLIVRERSRADARRQVIRLSDRGEAAFRTLDRRAAGAAARLLSGLSDEEQSRLVAAMGTIQSLLSGTRSNEIQLRPLAPGDFGWVVERHGALYAEEYGWDQDYEAFIARIVADYIEHRDPERENGWIAEADGARAGCVFCTKNESDLAQLRLLLVEPWARGQGVGSRLVDQCITFAQQAGYGSIVLWTNDVLVDARRIYERAGFGLDTEQRHHSFGQDLVGQTWRKTL